MESENQLALDKMQMNKEIDIDLIETASKSKKIVPLKIPSADEVTTFRHSLNLLKKRKRDLIMLLNKNNLETPSDFNRLGELIKYLTEKFQQGLIPINVLEDLRKTAFDPNLRSTDGFFLTFNYKFESLTKDLIEKSILEWKKAIENNEKNEENNYIIDAEVISFSAEKFQIIFMKKNERLIYDNSSMFSKSYYDVQKVLVEFYIEEQVTYFSTSNSVKFSAIKTMVSNFLNYLAGDVNIGIKLSFPKMSQELNFVLSADGRSASKYKNINPNTIKLLDLFLEIENASNFEDFECIDIKFDHEDKNKENLADKIGSQAYGCYIGDLFKKEEIKKHILNNRTILQIEFKIEHTTYDEQNFSRKHMITAGIVNDISKVKGLRIYIDNGEYLISKVIDDAYNDLKLMFISHLKSGNLKNENKIREMLGI